MIKNIALQFFLVTILIFHTNCEPRQHGNGKHRTNSNIQNKKQNRSIDELTKEAVVISYLKKNKKLPPYYITKNDARKYGWIAANGNLCNVLPGKAIGGDVFTNREGSLPKKKGRTWYEADLNYNCGRRNADRVLFSTDQLIFVTHDHYKTFKRK